MKTDTTRFRKTVVARALITAFCGTASMMVAQETLAQSTSLNRVEITGSAIKRVDAETALPVTVLKMDELKAQGFTTVESIMNQIAGNQTLLGTSQAIGATTGGGAFANLRGLGANKTLILLNGRRIANQAVGGAGDSSAPDLNTIPLAAIDRIEVLRDGASSLYGTDAVGGVINFITKKDYKGAEISAQYTSPQHPGGKSYEVNAGFGKGDLATDKWNIFGFIDYQKQDVLTTPQRPGFATANKTSANGFPGTWSQSPGVSKASQFAPACAQQFQAQDGVSCRYFYWNWVDLIPKSDRLNAMLKGTFTLPGDHQLNLEWTGAKTKVATNIAPVPEGALTIDPGTPFYPGNGITPGPTAAQGTLDPTQPVKVRWRTIPAGPRADQSDNTQQRFVASLDGTIADWDYNTGFSYNTITQKNNLTGGYVDDSVIRSAVKTGLLNPFAPVSGLTPAMQSVIAGSQVTGELWHAKGEVAQLDGKVSKELGDWFGAGRKTAVAMGAEIRHEKYTQLADAAFATKVISSSGFDPSTDNEGARTIWAVYGQLDMPVTKALEVSLSARYDKYPDFGSTFNPKVAFKYAPSDTWAMRGAATTGFRAPSLYELHSAQTFTNTAGNWDDPVRCPGGHPIAGVSSADNCAAQFMALTGGNAKLQPEKSQSATFGFVLQPMANFDATIDFWWINLKHSIGALSDTTVFGDPAKYASHFVRAPDGSLAIDGSQCNTVANPGPQCGYVLLLTDNLGGVKTNGVDLAANFRVKTADMGNWLFSAQETYVAKYEYQNEEGGPWIQNVGIYSGAGPIFRNQFTIAANWTMGPWAAGLVNHYKSGYLDQDGVGNVGAYSTWDLYGSWSPNKQLTITAGVKNLLDKAPPTSQQIATFQVGYDPRFADSLLRAYYIRGSYKF